MLVGEDARQDKDFFTTRMPVARKVRIGGVSHEAGRAGFFFSYPVQHHAIDTDHGRGHPLVLLGRDSGAAREICVDEHGFSFNNE